MNRPPNDVRYFVHKKLLRKAVGVAASFIPGGSTALAIGRSLRGGGGQGLATLSDPTLGAPLSDARRREITRAMEAASARGDSREASAFLRELGSQGPLGTAAVGVIPRASRLRDLGLTGARRREITKAMRAATARGDAGEASAFLRELGAQGPTRAPSIPPRNPVRENVIKHKPLPGIFAVPRRPRRRIPAVMPLQAPHPIGAPVMGQHRKRDKVFNYLTGGGGPECLPGTIQGPGGICVDLSAAIPGGDPLFQVGVGAVMGRYGPAYQGNSRMVQRTTCLPGDIVGNDGLCYPRKSLTNKERMWPRGRAPLLTGGEMRAISIASRAAGKFERTQKRLQKIGMLKKPAPRRVAPKLPPHQHQITSGG